MGTTRQKSSCRNRLRPHSLLRMKVGTHSPLPTGSHTAAYTPKRRALPDGAAITTLETYCTFTNIPGPGVRTANFAPLGSWPGRSRRTQKAFGTAMRSCASLFRRRRGPAGLRNLFSFLSKLWLVRPALRAFCVRGEGWYHYPQRALRVSETLDGRLPKGLTCRFLRLGSLH